MSFPTVITHGDADGVISLSLFFKNLGNTRARVYFSSAFRLIYTLCKTIESDNTLKDLYIFDLSGNEKALRLASVFDKVIWIDHHKWSFEKKPENIELKLDSSSPSASSLIAEYFGVDSPLVKIADEIDVNSAESEEAIFLRDLIASTKWKFSGKLLANKLKNISIALAFSGLDEFEKRHQVAELLSEYRKWVKEIEQNILSKVRVFNVNDSKIAIFETFESIPVHTINNKLLEHEEAPFDLIAVIMHKFNVNTKNIGTKIELRTQTEKDIFPIAESLGGGGHMKACAATLKEFINTEKFVEFLKENFKT
ncbi:MAG: hypothetical protein QW140_02635 [Candidatus Aenigmatarchaeota archaeon]